MVYRFRLPNGSVGEEQIPGTFIYRRKPGQGWALERVEFPAAPASTTGWIEMCS